MMDTDCALEFNYSTKEKTLVAWKDHIDFEWNRASIREQMYNNSNNKKDHSPFMICDSNFLKKPREKMQILLDAGVDAFSIMTVSVSSHDKESCFLVYEKASWCKDTLLALQEENYLGLSILPVSYAMKIISGSMDRIHELLVYNISSKDTFNLAEEEYSSTSKKQNHSTSDYIDAMLCPGILVNTSISQEEVRNDVLHYIDESIRTELSWYTSTSSDNTRQAFWKDMLSKEEDISTCKSIYDVLVFEFESVTVGDNVTIAIMSINFRTFESALHHKLHNSTSLSPDEITQIRKTTETCTQMLLLALAILPETCSIQTRPIIELKNQNAQWLVQTGVEGVTPWYDLGLDGSGEVVAISDTGIDLNHCYFEDDLVRRFGRPFTLNMKHRKVVQYDNYVNKQDMSYGHGTHTAASLAGCKSDGGGISKGIAYGAKLAFLDIGYQDGRIATPNTVRLLDTGRPYAKIHSASWGSSNPSYGVQAWLVDSYIYNQNDEMLLFIAAGNDGEDNKPYTVGEPATAKNVIAVGASHSVGSDASRDMLGPAYIASFSSRGPTRDGRTKPDLIAPGKWISSAASRIDVPNVCDPSDGIPPGPNKKKDGLVSFQGTSMSTPIAAGTAALIRQYLREGYHPTGEPIKTNSITNPSAALLKALLLNGAQYLKGVDNELNGVHPVSPYDNAQNFGRVSLVDTLYLRGKSNVQTVIQDRVRVFEGNSKFFTVTIDTSSGCKTPTFSATLVWTDPPGMPGCLDCLINDLDLYLHKNNDKTITYYPNGLTTKDSKNNAERIRLPTVKHNDTITMYVDASSIISPSQSFAIVAAGCMSGTANEIDMLEGDVFANDDSAEKRKKNVLMGIFIPVGFIAFGSLGYYVYNRRRVV